MSMFADAETVAKRMAICQACPLAVVGKTKKFICSKCGCVLAGKTRIARDRCPVGKW